MGSLEALDVILCLLGKFCCWKQAVVSIQEQEWGQGYGLGNVSLLLVNSVGDQVLIAVLT